MPPVAPENSLSRRPALSLLAQPDAVAEKLIAEIQRVIALEEEKDSKQLDRWSRRVRRHGQLQPLQSVGALAIAIGLLGGGITWLVAGAWLRKNSSPMDLSCREFRVLSEPICSV